MSAGGPIAILTSGVALGVHVPGLLLARGLRALGVPTTVTPIEELLPERLRVDLVAARAAFHADFRLARAGHRFVHDPSERLDEPRVAGLLRAWHTTGPARFVVFSGFWMPVLARYVRERPDRRACIEVCHVDSTMSPSFRAGLSGEGASAPPPASVRRLADADARALPTTIAVLDEPPVSWEGRDQRVLAHGGGWGMGTYREVAAELAAQGIGVDRVLHEYADLHGKDEPGTRSWLIDPDWAPWDDDGFPPFGLVGPDTVAFTRDERCHGSFHLTRQVRAVASKPGGGTLLDSLAAATPLILLDPLAPHEARNAELWLDLGLGVEHRAWIDAGCPESPLHAAHERLLEARTYPPEYAHLLAEEVSSATFR